MFHVNDVVLYGTDGVCRLTGIVRKTINGIERDFYELHPVFRQDAVLFLPTDNEKVCARLRHVLTREEILSAIHSMPEEETIWIESDSSRKEQYQSIIRSGDHVRIIQLIKTLYEQREKLKEKGRKMHTADENFLKEAEKILHEEFAFVLNIPQPDVLSFIRSEIGEA